MLRDGHPRRLAACAQRRPALYEERTSGPASTPRNPMSSATVLSSTNSCGLTQRATGRCLGLGRRYWVSVMMSQPASRRSLRARSISCRSSPIPRIRLDFVTRPALLACVMTSSDRSYLKAGRMRLKIRGTVSTLWANTSGFDEKTSASNSGLPEKSVARTSTPVAGFAAWMRRTVSACSHAPSSGRSSRATPVTVA